MYAKMVIRLIISRFVVPLYCKNVKLLYNLCKMFLQFGVISITRNMVLLILLILSACLAVDCHPSLLLQNDKYSCQITIKVVY